jgi:hypothetical protein
MTTATVPAANLGSPRSIWPMPFHRPAAIASLQPLRKVWPAEFPQCPQHRGKLGDDHEAEHEERVVHRHCRRSEMERRRGRPSCLLGGDNGTAQAVNTSGKRYVRRYVLGFSECRFSS